MNIFLLVIDLINGNSKANMVLPTEADPVCQDSERIYINPKDHVFCPYLIS